MLFVAFMVFLSFRYKLTFVGGRAATVDELDIVFGRLSKK